MNTERTEFLEARRSGIGGSDVAGILGLSKWATPYDVWNSKVTPIEQQAQEESQAMHFGNVLEDVVATEFSRRSGMKVQRRSKVYRHKQYPQLLANIDRIVINERAGLECKTSSAWMQDQWGESGTDEIPIQYLLQCQHYMLVTGMKQWWVAALIGGNDFRWYPIPANKVVMDFIEERCLEFWQEYVEKQTPPPATNLDDVAKLYQTTNAAKAIIGSDGIVKELERIKMLKTAIKKMEEEEESAKLIVQLYMQDNNTLLHPTSGDIVATWKASESNRLDTTALKANHPEIYQNHTTLTTSRRFLIK